MALWKRQTFDPNTYTTGLGNPAKGVAPPLVHVTYRVIGQSPYGPIVEYLYPSLIKHYYDTHGQLDHLKGYALPIPNQPDDIPRTLRGVIVSFISDVNCGGGITWTEQQWLLVPGTRLVPSEGSGCLHDELVVGKRPEWFRQTFNPGTYFSQLGAPAKGVSYDLILLKFRRGEDGQGNPTFEPICNPFDPEVKAKAGIILEDSHGQDDAILGIPTEGPTTTAVQSVFAIKYDCPPPLEGFRWRLTVEVIKLQFHPGSILLGQTQYSIGCCECCHGPLPPCCNPPGCSGEDCCTSTSCCIPTGTLLCGLPCEDFDGCDLVFNICCENEVPEAVQPAGCEYFVAGNRCVLLP